MVFAFALKPPSRRANASNQFVDTPPMRPTIRYLLKQLPEDRPVSLSYFLLIIPFLVQFIFVRLALEHGDVLRLRADDLAVLELNAVVAQTLFGELFKRLVLEVIPLLKDTEILDGVAEVRARTPPIDRPEALVGLRLPP